MTDVTDSFTGTTNTQLTAYSSNWTKASANDPDIQSNRLAADDSGNDDFCYWNADEFEDNQYCEIDRVNNSSTDVGISPACRMNGSGHCYFAFIAGQINLYLYDGGFSEIDSNNPTINDSTYRIIANGTTISVTENGSSTGMPSGTESTLSSGAGGVHSYDNSESVNLADNWLAGPIVAGATLTVADASCTSQVDAPTLTQVHNLTINDASCTTQVDAPVLNVGAITLTVNDAYSETQTDAVTLTQVHNIIVTNAFSTSQADNVDLSGASTLTIQDVSCITQTDAIALTQAHNLSINDSSCTSQVDSFALGQSYTLTAHSSHHGLTSTSPNLLPSLVVADASCTSQVDTPTLTQLHNLVMTDAFCTSQSDNVALTQLHNLILADAFCITQADTVTLTEYIHLSPASDSLVGNWTNELDQSTNLYESVNEDLTANDSDYIQSEQTPSSSPVVLALESGNDPLSSDGHVLRYRYAVDGAGTINLVVQLRQGYTNEGSPGTLIAEWTHNGIGAITTAEQTLSGAQADSITNYGSLFVRMVATEV